MRNTQDWNDWAYWLNQLGVESLSLGDGPRFTDYNLMVQAAVAGQGVILGSKPVLRGLVEAGLLVDPLERSVATEVGYDVVTTPPSLAREEVRLFIDWIVADSAMSWTKSTAPA